LEQFGSEALHGTDIKRHQRRCTEARQQVESQMRLSLPSGGASQMRRDGLGVSIGSIGKLFTFWGSGNATSFAVYGLPQAVMLTTG
jgi:hypothetical protein